MSHGGSVGAWIGGGERATSRGPWPEEAELEKRGDGGAYRQCCKSEAAAKSVTHERQGTTAVAWGRVGCAPPPVVCSVPLPAAWHRRGSDGVW